MKLSAAYILLAQKIQESATAMCHEDIRTRLQDGLRDSFAGTGNWCYIVAVFGDDKSGDVVYSCNTDLKKAAYTMSAGSTKIATDTAVDVQPLTTYETEAVELGEAGARNSRRDMTQLQAIHDASASLGAACTKKESAPPANVSRETSSVKLIESFAWSEEIQLIESSGKEVEIKIIAPGKGSSAFYPREVLKRDGPGVFKKNTQIYINHATRTEESERPEGDWHKLAGALSTDAYWKESAKQGAGLYAMAKFSSDIAPTVLEKAPYSGMSIRANGTAAMEAGRPKLQEGVPVLEKFTDCESIDVVTRAGAGGMILTEAATAANPTQGADMDAAELQKLNERLAATDANNARLLERAVKSDAREAAARILDGIEMAEASKARVIESALRELPKTDKGELDAVKFAELVNQEAKREAAYVAQLTGAGRISGMGAGAEVTPTDPEAQKKQREASTRLHKSATDVFAAFGISEAGVKAIAKDYGEEAA